MNRLIISSVLFFILPFSYAYSQNYYFEYNEDSQEIYQQIIDLKLTEASKSLINFKENDPNNLSALHLENYIDFFVLFINENENDFKRLEKNKGLRIAQIKKHLSDSDPYKKFALAEINLQWALARSKFGELFKASREIYKAYHLLTDNAEEHPNFIYNKKSLSIIHSLVETITLPGFMKKLLGLDGSIELGLSEIDEVIEHSYNYNFIFNQEADAIKAFILFFQANQKKEAWSFITESRLDPSSSLLSVFLVSKIAQRIGYNDIAIDILNQKPNSALYSEFMFLEFQMGLSKLRMLDSNSINHFKKYVQEFKGKHYIKEAYQKLAWASLVFDQDLKQYHFYISQVKEHGDELIDGDKQAMKETKLQLTPDTMLLKARLLFDGGYYNRSYNLLKNQVDIYVIHENNRLEYYYRLARCAQALEKTDEAIKFFSYVLNIGFYKEEYYACNSALQLGFIYELQNKNKKAKEFFVKCLSLSPKEYKTSLHQKAKSGIQRMVKR